MVTGDLVLELAAVLVIFVVALALPRMLAADRQSLAALHRQQGLRRHVQSPGRVQSIHAHPHGASPMRHPA